MTKTILITGGAGFIGTHLIQALTSTSLHSYRVRILDNLSPQIHGAVPRNLDWITDAGIEFVRGSITDTEIMSKALDGVEAVVHLAAETGTGQSMYQISHYNEVNSQGTAMLLEAISRQSPRTVNRVILASSRSIYGEGAYSCLACGLDPIYPDSRSASALAAHQWEYPCPRCNANLSAKPTAEDDRVRPASIYAATKFAQEDLVRIACESLGIGYAIYRFQNVYGEGQSLNNPYTGILSIFSTRVRRGLDLPVFEDGLESRDFVHVSDVAKAVQLGIEAEHSPDSIYNVGSGTPTSVMEIAGQLCAALHGGSQIVVTGQYRVGDIRHCYADMSRIKRDLGFVPAISLTEGLNRFADWVLTQPLPEDQLDRANQELKARKLMG